MPDFISAIKKYFGLNKDTLGFDGSAIAENIAELTELYYVHKGLSMEDMLCTKSYLTGYLEGIDDANSFTCGDYHRYTERMRNSENFNEFIEWLKGV